MHKMNMRSGGVARSFLICFGFAAFVLLILSMIMAAVASTSDDPTGKIGLLALLAMLISAAVSGIFTARFNPEGGIAFASLTSLLVVLIMLLCGVIVSSGRLSGGAFMNYGCYFGVYVLSAFLGKKRTRHHRHKR